MPDILEPGPEPAAGTVPPVDYGVPPRAEVPGPRTPRLESGLKPGLEPRLEQGRINVCGTRRTYWLAQAPREHGQPRAPLLIVLHGRGMDGRGLARVTGLDRRGPAAGITTVFPDGWRGEWHTTRMPDSAAGPDDLLFLSALTSHLEVLGAAESWPVFLAGMSNGAWFAEHAARHGLLRVAGLFLVAGTTLELSRRQEPVPLLHTSMTLVMGTADREGPYQGGRRPRLGLSGFVIKQRPGRGGDFLGGNVVAGAEDIAADWAAGNGIGTPPSVSELPRHPAELPVTRKIWAAPGCRPVMLYRIAGGGHAWPGSPRDLLAHTIDQATGNQATGNQATGILDTTGLLLDMTRREGAAAFVG